MKKKRAEGMRLGMRAHKNIVTSNLGIDSMLPPGSEAKMQCDKKH